MKWWKFDAKCYKMISFIIVYFTNCQVLKVLTIKVKELWLISC